MNKFNIRKAISSDIDTIHKLGRNVSELAVTDNTITFWPRETLARAVLSDDVVILVAEDEEITGFLIAQYNRGLKKATIENIFVHPSKRGQGMGDGLLKRALEILRDTGCEFVATLISQSKPGAVELYKKNGFRQGNEPFLWLDKSLSDKFDR